MAHEQNRTHLIFEWKYRCRWNHLGIINNWLCWIMIGKHKEFIKCQHTSLHEIREQLCTLLNITYSLLGKCEHKEIEAIRLDCSQKMQSQNLIWNLTRICWMNEYSNNLKCAETWNLWYANEWKFSYWKKNKWVDFYVLWNRIDFPKNICRFHCYICINNSCLNYTKILISHAPFIRIVHVHAIRESS